MGCCEDFLEEAELERKEEEKAAMGATILLPGPGSQRGRGRGGAVVPVVHRWGLPQPAEWRPDGTPGGVQAGRAKPLAPGRASQSQIFRLWKTGQDGDEHTSGIPGILGAGF